MYLLKSTKNTQQNQQKTYYSIVTGHLVNSGLNQEHVSKQTIQERFHRIEIAAYADLDEKAFLGGLVCVR